MNLETISNKSLKKELIKYWQSLQPKQNNFIKKNSLLIGNIKTILNDNEKGKNGFLTLSDKDYYFLLPKHVNFIDKIQLNTKVKFEILKLEDGKERAKILKVME